MGAVLVTPASTFPVTLTEAKAQCRVQHSDEDTYLDGLIASATAFVEAYTGRSIVSQTWRLTLDGFSDEIPLPNGPVSSVTTVAYYDTAGADQTLATGWTLDATTDPALIVKNASASWPDTQDRWDAVRITYVTGYSTAPAPIKHAILLLIGHWFAHREAVGEAAQDVPMTVDALLANYRSYGFAL